MVWRGGRDSKQAIYSESLTFSRNMRQSQDADTPHFPPDAADHLQLVTPRVPTSAPFTFDRAALLRHAADAIRAGMIERFTTEWRELLAEACEEAARRK